MDERMRFVARLLEGEKMAVLCREFDISRKTGYKLFNRFRNSGIEGLTDRSRRPYRHANRLAFQIENLILQLKEKHSSWGAQKIRDKIKLLHSSIHLPAISTVHAVLDRHGRVGAAGRKRYKAQGTTLTQATRPNDLWCADYKGEFMLADQRYCYPLTITDFSSRYLLCCDALGTTRKCTHLPCLKGLLGTLDCLWRSAPKRGALCQRLRLLRSVPALGVVAALGHRHRAHQARQPATKRAPRADASDPEEGSHQAAGEKLPPATGEVRSLHRLLQPGAASPSLERPMPRSTLPTLTAPL